MQFWEQLVASVATAAAVVAAVTYLLRVALKHALDNDHARRRQELEKDLALYRNELDTRRSEYLTRSSWIHQKKAEVIGEMYGRLKRAHIELEALVHLFQPAGQDLPERKRHVYDLCKAAENYYYENRVFLDADIYEPAEQVLRSMRMIFGLFSLSQSGEDYQPDDTDRWERAFVAMRDTLPPLLEQLEGKLRGVLHEIEPVAQVGPADDSAP